MSVRRCLHSASKGRKDSRGLLSLSLPFESFATKVFERGKRNLTRDKFRGKKSKNGAGSALADADGVGNANGLASIVQGVQTDEDVGNRKRANK